MSRTPAKFTQADVARALRAAEACATPREVVLEPDGRIRIVPIEPRKDKLDSAEQIRL